MIVQKIKKTYPTPIDVGIRYYALLSALNEFNLTPRELQIMAFTAIRGSISNRAAKKSCMELFNMSQATLGNMVWKMEKRGLLVRVENRLQVTPQLLLDFEQPLLLQIQMNA